MVNTVQSIILPSRSKVSLEHGTQEFHVPELYVFAKPVSAGCLAVFLLVLLAGACCFSDTTGFTGGRVALLLACLLYLYTCAGLLVKGKLAIESLCHQPTYRSKSIRQDMHGCLWRGYLVTYVPGNKGSKCSVQTLLCTHSSGKQVRVCGWVVDVPNELIMQPR
jgi:hypothetical protein